MLSRLEQSLKIKFDSNMEQKSDHDVETAIDDTRNWALSIIKIKHDGEIPEDEKQEIERILSKFRLASHARIEENDS